MTELLTRREGFGNIIADGVKIAAERIGKGSERYAMHIGDRRSPLTTRGAAGIRHRYGADPTPAGTTREAGSIRRAWSSKRSTAPNAPARHPPEGKHRLHACASAMGLCQFVIGSYPHVDQLLEALKAITGWEDLTAEELLKTGERITNVRLAFNIREGLKGPFKYPDRMRGVRPRRWASCRYHLHPRGDLQRLPRTDGLGHRDQHAEPGQASRTRP